MDGDKTTTGLRGGLQGWIGRHIPRGAFMMIAAVVTGVLTGLMCSAMKYCTSWLSSFLTSGFDADASNVPLLFFPFFGLVITRLLMRYVYHTDLSHGTDWLVAALDKGSDMIPRQRIYAPVISNIFTLGFGGSAGAEGPIAVSGAAIGGNVSRWLGMSPDTIRTMIGCGAGAGIAAIFKAPVGGMLFTLEILRLPFSTFTVLVLLLACISSWATCFITTGFTFDVYLRQAATFTPDMYLSLIAFGIIAGIYCLYYTWTTSLLGRFLRKLGGPWRLTLCAAAILGLLLFFFPSLYGEGYGVMDRVLNGDFRALTQDSFFAHYNTEPWNFIVLVGVLLLVKAVAVACTVDGGVAGDFAPTLFAGSMCGLVFALAANHLLGTSLPPGDYALIGMCAVFSGIIRAPFMAMFLTSEMTGNFTLLLPMVLASAMSYGIVRIVRSADFYQRFITLKTHL